MDVLSENLDQIANCKHPMTRSQRADCRSMNCGLSFVTLKFAVGKRVWGHILKLTLACGWLVVII